MKKLSEAKNGETGVISAIRGDTRFLSRVTSIGLTIGCPVTVLQNEKKASHSAFQPGLHDRPGSGRMR